jgi:hypothetical protein
MHKYCLKIMTPWNSLGYRSTLEKLGVPIKTLQLTLPPLDKEESLKTYRPLSDFSVCWLCRHQQELSKA